MTKILFHCVNGTGLGHLTRTLAVIRQLKRLAPDIEILVLTSSENSGFLWREGIASVKVPSAEVLQADRRLPVIQLAQAITAQTVAIFQPNAIVTESQPAGMFSEFLSSLLSVPKRVFIFGMFPNYLSNPLYQLGQQAASLVLMPYQEQERGLVGVNFGGRESWIGDILVRSVDELLTRETARNRLQLPADKLVFYVGLGGGGNPQNSATLNWILDTLSTYNSIQIVCAKQPLAVNATGISERPSVMQVTHFPMMEYFNAYDVAISASGFNCGEYVHAGLPTIWVPLGYPSTDQAFNANRFTDRNLGLQVSPFDTPALKLAIERLRDEQKRNEMTDSMRNFCPANGAEVAARAILEHLTEGGAGAAVPYL